MLVLQKQIKRRENNYFQLKMGMGLKTTEPFISEKEKNKLFIWLSALVY